MTQALDRLFHFSARGSTVRRELVGALTTFFAIAYIIFVTPGYLVQTGMDYTAVLIATCVSAALGCFLTGAFNLPFILTPGVGLNAFFTYTLCLTMGYTWQQGLAVVFISGALFLVVALTPLRDKMAACIPPSMKNAISAGLGMFIALIGLLNAGIVTARGGALLLGDLADPAVLLALLGLPCGVSALPQQAAAGFSLAPTFLKLDFGGVLSLGVLPLVTAVTTFTICLCFDTLGSVISIAGAGGLLQADGGIGENGRALTLSALGTCAGACLGAPALIPPVECSTGVSEGARTGLHSVFVGLLFLAAILVAPIAGVVPSAATAPSLILIGMLMIGNATNIYWHSLEIALPCFLTMIMIPFSYSVADGIGVGFISYAAIQLVSGKGRRVPVLTYALAGVFVAMYVLSAL